MAYGSLGSSDGCGFRTICAFLPVPRFKSDASSRVTSCPCTMLSSDRSAVPGTCSRYLSSIRYVSRRALLPQSLGTGAHQVFQTPSLYLRGRERRGKRELASHSVDTHDTQALRQNEFSRRGARKSLLFSHWSSEHEIPGDASSRVS